MWFLKSFIPLNHEGLTITGGIVLADNHKMLTLANEFGFSIGANLEREVTISRQF